MLMNSTDAIKKLTEDRLLSLGLSRNCFFVEWEEPVDDNPMRVFTHLKVCVRNSCGEYSKFIEWCVKEVQMPLEKSLDLRRRFVSLNFCDLDDEIKAGRVMDV